MAPIINPVAIDRIELSCLGLFDSMVAGILTLDNPIPTHIKNDIRKTPKPNIFYKSYLIRFDHSL